MALSTSLIKRLNSDDNDQPLAKRLKLAANIFYSPDLPIVCKEDCVLGWLCNELSDANNIAIWTTIHRCLSAEPKSFSRLSPETKNLLIENLINALNEYPKSKIFEEMLKSCNFIFLNSNIHSYSQENKTIHLISALFIFTSKVLISENLEKNTFVKSDIVLESAETAISMFAQICRQSFSEKRNLLVLFIEQLLFPIASLVKIIKANKIQSKIITDVEKCIKRLLLSSIRTISTLSENTEDNELIFNTMKTAACSSKVEDVAAAFTFIFQCAVNTFQQNSTLIDIILRKLLECTDKKTQCKQVLTAILENSADITYNFDNEIDGVTLKTFLKNQIEDTLLKKKHLKCADYNLLSSITKLNPLIIDDITQDILDRVVFEAKVPDEEIAYENLLKELWKASVRLRRHPKFLSRFLLTVANYQEKEVEDLAIKDNFNLPNSFIVEFKEDLRNKTTNSQILSMFHTLMFHLNSDCINKIKKDSTIQLYLQTKIVSEFFVIFFEHSNFLDNSLPQEWQIKFYQTFKSLKDSLTLFIEKICEVNNCEAVIIISYLHITKVWCESYDLLRYYAPNIVSEELDFPINDSRLKELKRTVKKIRHQSCEQLMNKVIFYHSLIYNRNNPKLLKDKIITELWSEIIENHFEMIENFNEMQILQLTICLINDASSSEDSLLKWSSILKMYTPRMTKKFATATILQIVACISKDMEWSLTKRIIEEIDFEVVLQQLDDNENNKKVVKIAKKCIEKQNFEVLNSVNFNHVKRNLQFLSHLPLSFLDPNIKILLFLILYVLEEEIKHTSSFKEFTVHLYLDILRQNDINILNEVSNPALLVNHFKSNQSVLLKIVKLSLPSLTSIEFWENFMNSEDCSQTIISFLLKCVDDLKSKTSSTEHKTALQNLSANLTSIFIKDLNEEIQDTNEIAGLRVTLKAIFLENKKLKKKIKKCVLETLKKIVNDNEFRSDSKSVNECLQMSLTVLSHREHFNIDEEIVRKFCIILINNPDVKLFFHFLEVLKDNEFEFFIKSLNNITKESVNKGDIPALENSTLIWQTLSKAQAKGSRSKRLSSSVNNLFNDLLGSEIHKNSSPFLLNILRAIVSSKKMIQLSNRLVDSTFVLSMECLNKLDNQNKLTTCQEALSLCSDYVRSRIEFILDKLPLLTNIFRKIIDVMLQEAKETNFNDERTLTILSIDIEKFCSFFVKLKKDVARISPYLIADLIKINATVGVLPSFMKTSFNTSISHLLSNCDRHAVGFLSRTLPASAQQIFKTIYDDYIKYHKFTGKI